MNEGTSTGEGTASHRNGTLLAAVAGGWGLLVGARTVYPVVLPDLQAHFGFSLTVAGLLVTVLWLCGALGQLPAGMLADRYDERTIMAAGAFVVAVALGLVAVAPTALVLFAATALWGFGHSLYPISRITFLSAIYSTRLGSALGVTMAAGDVGQSVLPPVAAGLAVAITWQAGLGFMVPLLILAGVGIHLVLPRADATDRSGDARPSRIARDVLAEVRTPAMGVLTVILFLYIFLWQSFTAFYPTYLMTVKGLSPSVASVLFGFFFAVGVVVKPLAGAAYDRFGMRGSLVGVLAPAVAGFALLPFLDGVRSLVAVTGLISFMLGSGAITQSHLAESFSSETRGTGLGLVRTITATLGASGPVLFGAVADAGYFDEGYLGLAAMMTGAILLTLSMPSR